MSNYSCAKVNLISPFFILKVRYVGKYPLKLSRSKAPFGRAPWAAPRAAPDEALPNGHKETASTSKPPGIPLTGAVGANLSHKIVAPSGSSSSQQHACHLYPSDGAARRAATGHGAARDGRCWAMTGRGAARGGRCRATTGRGGA